MIVRAATIILLLTGFSPTIALSEALPTHLCKFENTLLPCNHLSKPKEEALGTRFSYRPTKWTPLWPNFAIFGGLRPLAKDELRVGHEDSGVEVFDPAKPNIETNALEAPGFDASFIDAELAGYSTWTSSYTRNVLGLTVVDKVFHGEEVFDLWTKAIAVGLVCATQPSAFAPDTVERHCVFVREKPRVQHQRRFEYCIFDVALDSEIRSSPTCTTVASEQNGRRFVYSARYTSTSFAGGASGGEYTCVLPGVGPKEMRDFVEIFVKRLIGKSSRYHWAKGEYDEEYKAEGINIGDDKEKIFLRLYVFGRMEERTSRKLPPRFFMNINVTVSAQSSENIIDYREPNQALTNRLRNRFDDLL